MTNNKAIELLDNLLGVVEDNHGSDYDKAIHMAIDALKAEDAVEVVRCKDCKYNAKQDNESKFRNICTLRRPLVYVPVSDEDYCSRGEKKDEGKGVVT